VSGEYTLQSDASLRTLNTFGVQASAGWLLTVSRAEALPAALADPRIRGLPLMCIGDGSNVLLVDDFPGVVLRQTTTGVGVIQDDGTSVCVRADAAVGWDGFVDWSLAQGLAGLENLALIPGRVGAAPIQNIGAYGTEIDEFITTVEAWERSAERLVRLAREECGFTYRDSRFKHEIDRWIVTALELRLPRQRAPHLDYPGVREELGPRVGDPSPSEVAAAIRRIRRRKLPDPAVIGNAGSFFKNPIVPDAIADALHAEHPTLPMFRSGSAGTRKLSAAWFIDQCGWKGHREGDAGVAASHALVLVNHGKATGAELLALARRIAGSVHDRFGVAIEPEPRIVGATW